MRVEEDSLGERAFPEIAHYGIQTLRALDNFSVSGIKAPGVFTKTYMLGKSGCIC